MKNPMLKKDGIFEKITEQFADKTQNEVNIMVEQDFGEIVGFFKPDHDIEP